MLRQALGEDARGPEDLLRPSRLIGGADGAEQPLDRQAAVRIVREERGEAGAEVRCRLPGQ